MAAGTPLTAEEFEKILRNNSRNVGPGGLGSSIIKGPDLNPVLDALSSGLGGLTNVFAKTATGNLNLSSTVEIAKNVFYKLGPVGQIFNDTVVRMVETGIQLNDSLKRTSQSGFYFGNDLAKFSQAVNQSRLGLEGFVQLITANSRQLIILGDRQVDAGSRFGELIDKMAGTDLGKQLVATTGNAEILADTLLTVTSGLKYVDKSTTGLNTLGAQSVMLADEMDRLARLTGASTKQLNQQLQEKMREAQNSAYIRTLTDAEQARYRDGLAKSGAMGGPIMQRLFEQLHQHGNATEKATQDFLAAMGPAGSELMEMVQASKTGVDATGAFQRTMTAMADRMNDPQYIQMVKLSGAGFQNGVFQAAAALETTSLLMPVMEEANKRFAEYQQLEPGGAKTKMDFIIEGLETAAKAREKSLSDPGAQLALTFNRSNELIQRAAAGTSAMFVFLNEQMGKNSKLMSAINGQFEDFNPEKIKELTEKFMTELNKAESKVANQESIEDMKKNKIPVPGYLSGGATVSGYDKPNISTTSINKDPNAQVVEKLDQIPQKISAATNAAVNATSGVTVLSREDQANLLNDMNKHLGQISTYMSQLISIGDKQVTQFKNMISNISGNRGAP